MTTLNLQVSSSAGDVSIGNYDLTPVLTYQQLDVGSVNGNTASVAAMRFTNVTVAQGTAITSATLILTAKTSYNAGGTNTIRAVAACHDTDNAGAFATSSGDLKPATRPRTTANSGNKDLTSVTAGTEYTFDVTTAVQEILDRAGWSSGNAIVVLVDNNGSASNEWQEFEAYDHSTTLAPKLQIVYTAGSTYTLTAAQGSYTLSGQAAALAFGRLLTAAQGSYTLSWQAAVLTYDGTTYTMTATQGSHALSGGDAVLTIGRLLTAAQGSYTLSGQALAVAVARLLTAAQGSYTLTGQAAALAYSGDVVVTPDGRVYMVMAERRVYDVAADNRTYTIETEQRILTV